MSRSVRIHEFGDAGVLHIEQVEVGEPAPGEVRLRIHALGLNRTEITLRSGRSPAKPPLPTGLGFEAGGTIEALGAGVTGFSRGDRVALVPAYGAAKYALYGEVAIAPARSLVAIPDGVGFNEAAATWAAYGTAWGGLIAVGALKAGQTVLIPAASSGVGLVSGSLWSPPSRKIFWPTGNLPAVWIVFSTSPFPSKNCTRRFCK